MSTEGPGNSSEPLLASELGWLTRNQEQNLKDRGGEAASRQKPELQKTRPARVNQDKEITGTHFCPEALLPPHQSALEGVPCIIHHHVGTTYNTSEIPRAARRSPRLLVVLRRGGFTQAGYRDLVSSLGSLSVSISPADWKPLEAGQQVPFSSDPCALSMVPGT